MGEIAEHRDFAEGVRPEVHAVDGLFDEFERKQLVDGLSRSSRLGHLQP